MKYTILILGLLIAVLVSGCDSGTIGGPCEYYPDIYTATITVTEVDGTEVHFTFEKESLIGDENQLAVYEMYSDMNFTHDTGLTGYEVGQEQLIQFQIRSLGSCRPFIFDFVDWED
ncbi:hypothetical protein HOC80_03000 [archaeon]|jgi:hypothetical protein|nr:hypothetical protein [archaeon]MBT4417047.1 hypothetical protein [archaeon]